MSESNWSDDSSQGFYDNCNKIDHSVLKNRAASVASLLANLKIAANPIAKSISLAETFFESEIAHVNPIDLTDLTGIDTSPQVRRSY